MLESDHLELRPKSTGGGPATANRSLKRNSVGVFDLIGRVRPAFTFATKAVYGTFGVRHANAGLGDYFYGFGGRAGGRGQ